MAVDDFAPSGTVADVQRTNRQAGDLIRAQGNRAGKLRMRADTTLREAKDPRGLVAISGEDVPPGHSVRARMFVVQLPKDSIDWERMTAAQADGEKGLYAASMAGYVAWLAQDYDGNRRRLHELQVGQRAVAERKVAGQDGAQHRRTPDAVASLMVGFMYLTSFARSVGALTREESDDLHVRAWAALTGGADEQAANQADEEPCQRFFDLLRGALTSGRAHVVGMDDGQPGNPGAWGWQWQHDYLNEPHWAPRGAKVGWVDGKNLYLEPEASYAAAKHAGDGLVITAATLRRRLADGGFLQAVEAKRERTTVRKTIAGVRQEVLHLAATLVVDVDEEAALSAGDAATTVPVGQSSGGENKTVPAKRPKF
jgi:hypothetical protein